MTINHKVGYISGMPASFHIKNFIKTSHSINRLKKQQHNYIITSVNAGEFFIHFYIQLW